MGHPKFKKCHVTSPRPFQGWFVVHRQGLATVNLYTKYEVSMFTHYEDMTRDSAMAEGPRDALISRNSATTKYPYRMELFA